MHYSKSIFNKMKKCSQYNAVEGRESREIYRIKVWEEIPERVINAFS